MCRSTVHWQPHEIKALCFNLELRTKFFTLKCLYLSRASWRNGSIPHIWVSQNGTETTNLPVNVSVRVTLSRLEQRRADFQPLGVRALFETALRMNSSTGSFIQTFMLRKWHARRVVARGGMDGWRRVGEGGEAFPASWLDSTRWRVLGAGLDGRSARGDGRAKRAGGHTHTRTSTRGQLSPPSCFKLKDSQLGRQ